MANEINCKDFNEYQSLALRTCNDKGHLQNMLHAIMGMSGEAGELAELGMIGRDKAIGELGDCMWYCTLLSKELGLEFQKVVDAAWPTRTDSDLNHFSPEMQALLYSCRLMDIIKKSVFYGKEPQYPKLFEYLHKYVAALLGIALELGTSLIDAGSINIRKLSARYPDLVFSAEKAINRDYEAESKASGVKIA